MKKSSKLQSLKYAYLLPGDLMRPGCIGRCQPFHHQTPSARVVDLNYLSCCSAGSWWLWFIRFTLCFWTCRFMPGFTLVLEKAMNAASVSFRIPSTLTFPADADCLDVLDQFAPGNLSLED